MVIAASAAKGRAEWCPPAFLPRTGDGVLFLDELAQAPPLVQAACLQLVLDRRLGEYELPAGWAVMAASNRQEDRAGTHRLISPLLNRFVHLDLEVSLDDWQAWERLAWLAPWLALCASIALAQAVDPSRVTTSLAVEGNVERKLTLTVDDLKKLPPREIVERDVAGGTGVVEPPVGVFLDDDGIVRTAFALRHKPRSCCWNCCT